ncbi:MAG: hypothetical protein IJ325_13445 [Clostridia bacterium]|nr:hypothetical protein [Clostridia bacterium]
MRKSLSPSPKPLPSFQKTLENGFGGFDMGWLFLVEGGSHMVFCAGMQSAECWLLFFEKYSCLWGDDIYKDANLWYNHEKRNGGKHYVCL